MSIASLRRQVSVAGVPADRPLATGGNWNGSLRYASVGGWTGDIHLKDTDVPFEAFAQPIHVVQADASLDEAGAVLKHVDLTVGGIEATGEYRYEIGVPHPHRFQLKVVSANAADLETMLLPALKRGNILTYAFNFGRAPQPGWLVDMHAEGAIQVGSLTVAGTPISNLRGNLVWDGTEVSFTGIAGRVADSPFSGTAKIHLAARQPRYEVTGNLSGFAWQGGTLTAIGGFHTFGTGADLLCEFACGRHFHRQEAGSCYAQSVGQRGGQIRFLNRQRYSSAASFGANRPERGREMDGRSGYAG